MYADTMHRAATPPVASEDAVGDMRRSIDCLAEALGRAQPTRLVAVSDYGAHVGEWIGMPSVFRLFEERLHELAMPKVFLRSAEHMEGWGWSSDSRAVRDAVATHARGVHDSGTRSRDGPVVRKHSKAVPHVRGWTSGDLAAWRLAGIMNPTLHS